MVRATPLAKMLKSITQLCQKEILNFDGCNHLKFASIIQLKSEKA